MEAGDCVVWDAFIVRSARCHPQPPVRFRSGAGSRSSFMRLTPESIIGLRLHLVTNRNVFRVTGWSGDAPNPQASLNHFASSEIAAQRSQGDFDVSSRRRRGFFAGASSRAAMNRW